MSVALSPPHGFLLGEKRTFANKGCFRKNEGEILRHTKEASRGDGMK